MFSGHEPLFENLLPVKHVPSIAERRRALRIAFLNQECYDSAFESESSGGHPPSSFNSIASSSPPGDALDYPAMDSGGTSSPGRTVATGASVGRPEDTSQPDGADSTYSKIGSDRQQQQGGKGPGRKRKADSSTTGLSSKQLQGEGQAAAKQGRGRPKGSKNRPKLHPVVDSAVSTPSQQLRKRWHQKHRQHKQQQEDEQQQQQQQADEAPGTDAAAGAGSAAATMSEDGSQPAKRARGRPKGSKNKPKPHWFTRLDQREGSAAQQQQHSVEQQQQQRKRKKQKQQDKQQDKQKGRQAPENRAAAFEGKRRAAGGAAGAAGGVSATEDEGRETSAEPTAATGPARYKQLISRVKNQILRIRQEEHLINVYAADGWKGASREKVRLTAQLERAEDKVERCRAIIRDAVRQCDEQEGRTPLPAQAFDEAGEVDQAHICCAVCKNYESYDDNDIILCDGSCNCAYHEKCLDPPICAAELPEDEGWLCPSCDCKADILHILNQEFDTNYAIDTPWHEILQDMPMSPHNHHAVPLHHGRASAVADDTDPATSAAGHNGSGVTLLTGDLPSSDEEDEDFMVQHVNNGSQSSSSGEDSANSSDDEDGDEDSSVSSGDAHGSRSRDGSISGASGSKGTDDEFLQRGSVVPEHEEMDPDKLILTHKRRRQPVDYVALHTQMFGAATNGHWDGHGPGHDEDDEDFDPDVRS